MTKNSRSPLTLHVIEHGSPVCTTSRDTVIAELGSDIIFDPDVLDTYSYAGWQAIHHDLLVLSAAVEYADRSRRRPITQRTRSFRITVPVVELETWLREDVQENLRSMLHQLTGDNWHFHFLPFKGKQPVGSTQRSLPFGANQTAILPYSNGLDSRCVAKIYNENAICVRLTKTRNAKSSGDQPFDQIPFKVFVRRPKETMVRSRGFKFSIVATIAAHIARANKIIIPESGQGALGPVLVPLHNLYPDYRNHPAYFAKLTRFVHSVLSHKVSYEQPRLWHTKGETIAAYLQRTNSTFIADLHGTRSCWQQRHNAKKEGRTRQCGLCAACLLRRMSMHAAGLQEPDTTYTASDLTVAKVSTIFSTQSDVRWSRTMFDYAVVAVRHLDQLASMASLPDVALQAHAFEISRAIGAPQKETLEKLRTMLQHHATEWRAFVEAQGRQSFIHAWTRGGRYGRPD